MKGLLKKLKLKLKELKHENLKPHYLADMETLKTQIFYYKEFIKIVEEEMKIEPEKRVIRLNKEEAWELEEMGIVAVNRYMKDYYIHDYFYPTVLVEDINFIVKLPEEK